MKPRAGSDIGLQKPINAIFGSTPSTKPVVAKHKQISDTDSASKVFPSDIKAGILKKVDVNVDSVNTTVATPSHSNENKKTSAAEESSLSPDCDANKLETPLPQFTLDPKTPEAKSVKFVDNADVAKEEEHIGKSVRKYFEGHGWFTGKVVSHNIAENEEGVLGSLWAVKYQDGDSEELSEEDLLVYLNEFNKHNDSSSSVKVAVDPTITNSSKDKPPPKKATLQRGVAKKSTSAWCPEGWRIEERVNPPDAKSKPGELVKTWVAPDGTAFKTLKAAKKRADASSSTDSDKKTAVSESAAKKAKKEEAAPLSSFFANVKPKADKPVVDVDTIKTVEIVDVLDDDVSTPLATPAAVEKKEQKEEEEEEEWVQCDGCSKWRKLAVGMRAGDLSSETWTCSLNTWDISQNTCEVPQELSNAEIDAKIKKSTKSKVASTVAKSHKKKPVVAAKKALCPEAQELARKYRKELDKVALDYESIMKLDSFTRESQLSSDDSMTDGDTSFGDAVLPADIEVMKQGVPWALQLLLTEEAVSNTSSTTENTESTSADTTTTAVADTSGLTSASFPVAFQKLVACFIQGSSAPLPLLVEQLKSFCNHQASEDDKAAQEKSEKGEATPVETDTVGEQKMDVDEVATTANTKDALLSKRAALLRGISSEELSAKIPLIAERKCYGTTLRGQALLLLNQDVSPLIHAKWEVINLDLIAYSSESRKLVEASKKERRRVGNFIKVWQRLVDVIEKQPFDKTKVEVEETKLEKLNMEEKARLLKQAQAEAKEAEAKRALERKKAEKIAKALELAEKDKEKLLAMELKQKEKEKEAAEKARVEKEAEEKKKKQSMKFMGFFKPSANTVPLTSITPMSCSIASPSSSSSKTISSSSSSSSSRDPLKRDEKTTPSIMSFGLSSSSSSSSGQGGVSSLSASSSSSLSSPLPSSSSSSSSRVSTYTNSIAFKRKQERLEGFDKKSHDEAIKEPMSMEELSLSFSKRLKHMEAKKSKSFTSTETLKKRSRWTTAKVSVVTEVDSQKEAWGQSSSFVELKDKFFRNKMCLLQFQEDERPAYWGTWSKQSKVISGRRPLAKDHNKLRHYGEVSKDGYQLNYEVDSEEEWEEEEPGEDLDNADEEEEEDEGLDYADGWLRKDDELGSDEEDEEGARYMHNGDEQPNPPSVEGPFVSGSGNDFALPEHLNKYRAIPMPWVVSSTIVKSQVDRLSDTSATSTATASVESDAGSVLPTSSPTTVVEHKIGCFPMKILDSLRDSLALYDLEQPKPPKAPKQPKTSTTTTATATALSEATPIESSTPESAAAAFAAATSIVASLQAPVASADSSTSEPPAKKPKAEPKMVTNVAQLAFLAGIVHQSQGWNCDKIIATFVSKYPEHTKVATKRSLDDIAVAPKGRGSWVLKPESLAKFGIEGVVMEATVSETNSVPSAASTPASYSLATIAPPSTTVNVADSTITAPVSTDAPSISVQTTSQKSVESSVKATASDGKLLKKIAPTPVQKVKSPSKRPAPASMSIVDMFARKSNSPIKKQKVISSDFKSVEVAQMRSDEVAQKTVADETTTETVTVALPNTNVEDEGTVINKEVREGKDVQEETTAVSEEMSDI